MFDPQTAKQVKLRLHVHRATEDGERSKSKLHFPQILGHPWGEVH